MRLFVLAASLALLAPLFLGAPARAEGLVRRLPTEKCWATYRMTEDWSDGTKRELEFTLRVLKQAEYRGKASTWLEMVVGLPHQPIPRRSFLFLIENDAIGTGGDLLGKALVVWSKNENQLDTPTNYSRKADPWDGFLPRLKLLFIPAEMEMTSLQTELIDVGHHPLVCQRVSGHSSYRSELEAMSAEYRVAVSQEVPFGTAAYELTLRSQESAELSQLLGNIRIRLTDFGPAENAAK